MLLKADWLPGGQVELPPLPIKGRREADEVISAHADYEALLSEERQMEFAACVLSALNAISLAGPEKAKEMWDNSVKVRFPLQAPWLVWSVDDFVRNIELYRTQAVYVPYGVKSDAEAKEKLVDVGRSISEKSKELGPSAKALAQLPLTILYWRIRAAKVKSIITPAGPKPFPTELADRDKAMDLLAEVVDDTHLAQMSEAPKRPMEPEDMKAQSAADIRGKSPSAAESVTESRPSSTPSSDAPTATTTA